MNETEQLPFGKDLSNSSGKREDLEILLKILAIGTTSENATKGST